MAIMGLLDSVVGALADGLGGGNNGLVEIVMQLINSQPGGLGGLVLSFHQRGLGEVVNSWVSPEQASGSLAELRLQVVDKLTPDGQLPPGGDLLA